MPPRRREVLTGPAGAAVLGLDGFAQLDWDPMFCAPHTSRPRSGLIRVTNWHEPTLVGEVLVAHPLVVVRHLGEQRRQRDRIGVPDRIELAIEHLLREEVASATELADATGRSTAIGDKVLREVMARRRGEPAAESFAEVRAIQLLRSASLRCWRQCRIFERGRIVHRVDLVIPFDQCTPRPERLRSGDGLLVEIDSRAHHEHRFDEDHARQTTYDVLGHPWTTVTPKQIEASPTRTVRALVTAYETARGARVRTG
jgi:hypothetical protein